MNTILIAEDEKFIRLGLKTMTQRSGIPVREILEARDGEEALEILRSRPVDLLITDIRMPRMDGIELARQLKTLPEPPMVLAVSGYEDFNYAVSMLRNGVADYLLKPVERQLFCQTLEKLESQYQHRIQAKSRDRQQYLQALRSLILEKEGDSAEAKALIERNERSFFQEDYVGFFCDGCPSLLPEDVLALRGVENGMFYLAPAAQAGSVAAALPAVRGESGAHHGMGSLRECYFEAYGRWQQAFFTGAPCKEDGTAPAGCPSVTVEQLLGLVSLSRDKELLRLLRVQERMVAQGDLQPEAFAKLCAGFIRGICTGYKNLVDPVDDPEKFAQVWAFGSAQRYLEELADWLSGFCGRIAQEFADYENKQKIRQAVQYIQEHFRSPLNMAVVSNHVSMNYSLFSLLFKQYTGTNFVSYLQNLRITETKRLLEETDWRVGEIGRRVGFVDEKHFLKVFKNATGLSPTEYRKSLRLRSPGEETQ